MANTYTARIRAKLDSADLQKQIDAIAKSAKEIKINLNVDDDVQKLFEQINSKMSSTSKAATITPKVDTKQAENGIDVLQKKITRFAKDGSQSVENITKSVGTTFDKITSEVDGNVKTITQDYASATKRIAQLESQINTEISKTKSLLNDMNTESSMRYQLEQRLNALQSQGTSQNKLEQAKALTAETRDWLTVSQKVLETQQKITQEQRAQEQKQATAANRNQEKQYRESLQLNKQIDAELQKIQTRMKEINITAEKRAQIENEIKNATAMQNDSQKLQSLKNINTEITAMGKNAMSLGSMLQTAYEKFAIWSIATVSWYAAVHAVQDMIDNVISLDTSLTELRKVTDLSGESLDNFTEKAYDMSTELARTGQEVVDATTEFAKAGYNLQESMALAEDALLWKNISDGMVEVSDASNMIIANLKAFDKQGISSRHIIDSLNEVA